MSTNSRSRGATHLGTGITTSVRWSSITLRTLRRNRAAWLRWAPQPGKNFGLIHLPEVAGAVGSVTSVAPIIGKARTERIEGYLSSQVVFCTRLMPGLEM